jgi:hypothetical protein
MRILITEQELVYASPWKPRGDWRDFSPRYDSRSGDQLAHVQDTHKEFKHLLSLAIEKSQEVPIVDITILLPNLLDASEWGGYMGSPWDKDANAHSLHTWWKDEMKREENFYINGRVDKDSNENPIGYSRWTLIDFSNPGEKKHEYFFMC